MVVYGLCGLLRATPIRGFVQKVEPQLHFKLSARKSWGDHSLASLGAPVCMEKLDVSLLRGRGIKRKRRGMTTDLPHYGQM